MSYSSISIVITTFNGQDLLKRFLPSVVKAVEFYKGESEIILIDDGGQDGSGELIRNNFPEINLIRLERNLGPLPALNQGIMTCKNQIIILLDNDVLVREDFIYYLVTHFNDENVFAVRPGLKKDPQREVNDLTNPNISGEFKFGLIYPNVGTEKTSLNLAFIAGGGACALSREKVLALGGFDELFSPFYYEDADLSYRARKRGWKIVYEPRSLVFHNVTSSIRRFNTYFYIAMIAERNRYFLVWKNITDLQLISQHLVFIPVRLFLNLIKGRFACIAGFFCALWHLREVLRKRNIQKQFARVGDREIFNYFNE